jgi:ribosomal protein L17
LKDDFDKGKMNRPEDQTKICTKCNIEKSVILFPYRKNRGVYESRCKKCRAEIEKARRLAKRDEINAKRQNKTKTPQEKISKNLRLRIINIVKKINERNIYSDLLGCNRLFFKRWFEFQFEYYSQYNLNWDNHGIVWEIEHVMPCNSFDLTNKDQQKICFHWTNTSCVPKIINLSKGSKLSAAHIVSQKVRVKQFIQKLNTTAENTQQLKYSLL